MNARFGISVGNARAHRDGLLYSVSERHIDLGNKEIESKSKI